LQGIGMALLLILIAGSWVFGTTWLSQILMPPVGMAMGFYLGLADTIAALIA
jgi:hypothetical protein